MRQSLFENRQKAEELIQEAIRIWRESDHPDQLEGIEQDPVMGLLMTALAAQSNETDLAIEGIKGDVVEAFGNWLTPYETGHAIPATAVVETGLQAGLPYLDLTENHVFGLADSEAAFIPLLQTRVVNAAVEQVVRIDGRRWRVTLRVDSPVADWSGFAFAIRNQNFKDLKVSTRGQLLPIVNPWDFSELPLSPCFALDSILYNRAQTYSAAVSCLDLFAKQNMRIYCVKRHEAKRYGLGEAETVTLVFEFTGIKEGFYIDKDNLVVNPVILVNAYVRTADLSWATPIVRVAGYQGKSSEGGEAGGQQFMHMLRPLAEQLYGKFPVEVRRLGADRFNQGALVGLLNTLINRYYSDFYAFLNLRQEANDRTMQELMGILRRMREAARADQEQRVPGVYLMLKASEDRRQKVSLSVRYVTTLGAGVNSLLKPDSVFTVPLGINGAATRQIAVPSLGFDEIRDSAEEESLSRYYLITNDRLVTPADLKLFCYNELQTRFGISRTMVEGITVSHRQQQEVDNVGYEIVVEIVLVDNSFIRRGLEEKIPQVEMLLQAMMSVRSANIYPVTVMIRINKKTTTKRTTD